MPLYLRDISLCAIKDVLWGAVYSLLMNYSYEFFFAFGLKI